MSLKCKRTGVLETEVSHGENSTFSKFLLWERFFENRMQGEFFFATEHGKKLEGAHRKTDMLTVTRDEIHEHVGMTIYFSLKWGVDMKQHNQNKKFCIELPPGLRGMHTSAPARSFLLRIDTSTVLLTTENNNNYHCATEKLLYEIRTSQSFSQLSAVFHCASAKHLNAHAWNKLKHAMGHICRTLYAPIIIDMHN